MDDLNSNLTNTSYIKAHVLRLKPDQDLYKELADYITKNKIKAAFILSCVGSLKEINIRLASGKTFLSKKENFEIVSLVGCISLQRTHLHISLSDYQGNAIGGHLLDQNNFIFTTAEIVLGELPQLEFTEEKCELSGWPELKVCKKE